MIDIHCHVIPFVDEDGPQTLEESLKMLDEARREGISCVIATPHMISGESPQKHEEIQDAFARLRENAEENRAGIDLKLGAEVYATADLCDFVRRAAVSLAGAGSHVLIELPMHEFPSYTQPQLFALLSEGIIPILAHPERNLRVMKNPELLFSLSRAGILFQINSGSLLGVFGKEARKVAITLLNSGLCHFVASDAHNSESRSFMMKEARSVVQKMAGEALTKALFEDNPAGVASQVGS